SKDVVGAFEHPAPAAGHLTLQVLQKTPVKPIGFMMPGLIEPLTVTRNAVSRIEAQAGKYMRRDLGTFLRRIGVDRVHAAKFRRQQAEKAQLARHTPWPRIPAGCRIPRRVGMDQLPYA